MEFKLRTTNREAKCPWCKKKIERFAERIIINSTSRYHRDCCAKYVLFVLNRLARIFNKSPQEIYDKYYSEMVAEKTIDEI